MFTVAGQVGKMFAGAMMAAIHKSMDGYAGLDGWQWVFLIDGIITCPVAIFGFFFFPDIPEITRARYLSQEERELALNRLPPKREDGHNIQPWSLAKRVLGRPILYVSAPKARVNVPTDLVAAIFAECSPPFRPPCKPTSSRALCSST